MADQINYLTSDQRRRLNAMLMAEQYNRPTPQVVNAGGHVSEHSTNGI